MIYSITASINLIHLRQPKIIITSKIKSKYGKNRGMSDTHSKHTWTYTYLTWKGISNTCWRINIALWTTQSFLLKWQTTWGASLLQTTQLFILITTIEYTYPLCGINHHYILVRLESRWLIYTPMCFSIEWYLTIVLSNTYP